MKSLFIVFDGPEGAGKSTQAKLLFDHLKSKNYDVVLTREPGGSKVSEAIRKIILSPSYKITPLTELLLYEAARAQHIEEIIIPSLKKNKIVICDRFYYSTIVYQGYARGLSINFIEKLNKLILGKLEPNIVFLLDVSAEEGLKRVKAVKKVFDRLENENINFHKKIRKGYLELFKNKKNFYIITTQNKLPQQVHLEILKILRNKFRYLNI
ncbi:MAG: dTMP kinase [Elusimicrobiota bacterium]|nr:dTMP kinase [Endomicrobiia bacterium]MDW8166091.1 dTMP kinase [Elusimicrobiota bacterium]